jgi:molybdopterin-guanine dinucleotide biosynthesis protein A
VLEIDTQVVHRYDPQEKSFQNINTPEDYFRLRGSLASRLESDALQESG